MQSMNHLTSDSANPFSIHIKAPQGIRGIHPLTVAVRTNLALHTVMAEASSPKSGVSIRCGVLRAGKAANSLPEEAWLKGVLSAAGEEAALRARVEEIAHATAAAFRASAEVSWGA